MAYVETSKKGLGSRLGDSLKGLLAGVVLLVVGTCLLWWNEGRAVRERDAINEAMAVTVELPGIDAVAADFDGKMVHASGRADADDLLADPLFKVEARGILLRRHASFYQWVETSETETDEDWGGSETTTTTYDYEQAWVEEPVDSARFHDPDRRDANRLIADIATDRWPAKRIAFGAYTLPDFLARRFDNPKPVNVDLTPEALAAVADKLSPAGTVEDKATLVHVNGNTVYLGASPAAPEIGDIRVTFTIDEPADVSILARVKGDTFEPFLAKNGNTFSRLEMGTRSADLMFAAAHGENNQRTWILRLVGVLAVVFGLGALMKPLTTLASVIPPLATVLRVGTGLVSILVGVAWSLAVIAVAWIRFRPVLGILLLALAAGAIYLLIRRARAKKETATPQESA